MEGGKEKRGSIWVELSFGPVTCSCLQFLSSHREGDLPLHEAPFKAKPVILLPKPIFSSKCRYMQCEFLQSCDFLCFCCKF